MWTVALTLVQLWASADAYGGKHGATCDIAAGGGTTKVIAIAAGSAMGKTLMAEHMQTLIRARRQTCEILSQDWFYKNPTDEEAVKLVYPVSTEKEIQLADLVKMKPDALAKIEKEKNLIGGSLKVVQNMAKGEHDWFVPKALDRDAIAEVIEKVVKGEAVSFHTFDFGTKLRDGATITIPKGPNYLIVEGVFALLPPVPSSVNLKMSITVKDYKRVGLDRARARGRDASEAALKAEWKKAYSEYETYIKKNVEALAKDNDIELVANDGTEEDFKANIAAALKHVDAKLA